MENVSAALCQNHVKVSYKYPVVLVASLSAGGRGTPAVAARVRHVTLQGLLI
jgi:hypothetical protein